MLSEYELLVETMCRSVVVTVVDEGSALMMKTFPSYHMGCETCVELENVAVGFENCWINIQLILLPRYCTVVAWMFSVLYCVFMSDVQSY